MIPLKDNIPTARFPVVTVALIAINVLVMVWQWAYPTDPQLDQIGFSSIDQSAMEYGAIPYRITHPSVKGDCEVGAVNEQLQPGVVCPETKEFAEANARGEANPNLTPIPIAQAIWFVTLFTSMFMHGGILHILGNMLFLWVFGNNIEDAMGRVKFLLFYLAAGIVAVYSQAALDPSSTAPVIGASGAVAGVLGAYALLHPKARVLTLIFIIFFVTLVEIPALILLAVWFVLQFVPAIGQVAAPEVGGGEGIAYFAHVGGFIFGLLTIRLLANDWRDRDPDPSLPVH